MNDVAWNFIAVGAILFTLGTVGFLARRNLFVMILSIEMMLQGVAINLVTFSKLHGNHEGQAFVVFLLAIAACEAAIALALFLVLYRSRKSLDVALWSDLSEVPLEPSGPLNRPGEPSDVNANLDADNAGPSLPALAGKAKSPGEMATTH